MILLNINNTEIERKFLIRYPDATFLASNATYTEITQTYLAHDEKNMSERVRKRGKDGFYTYTHTCKTHVNAMRRIEIENEISEAEYLKLLERADPERKVINKIRWCLPYNGQLFEIDVFRFWNDRAYMEIELSDESDSIDFPPDIEIIKEVTGDRRYTNASLAKSIPMDDI